MARGERRVKRWSAVARIVHWSNLVVVLTLLYTGIALYVPGANPLAKALGGFFVTRTLHRGAAIVFIVVPLAAIFLTPGGFRRFLTEVFSWGKDDLTWLLSFPAYFFRPSRRMPPTHAKNSSGQRVLAWILISGALVQVVTGPILWLRPFSKGVVLWAIFFHDFGAILIGTALIFHVYVGLGIFKPYRGVTWGMLGNGTVPETMAKEHWPEWYAETPEAKESP